MTRTAGTTGAVTADIDLTTQPRLPRNHRGYAFVKSATDLPLTVLGEGDAPPTGFAASNGNEQVTLTWDAPAADADVARHEYRFKTTGDYPAAWTAIGESAPGGLHEDWVVVAGLTNDVAYTFQLRAVNAGGDASTAAEAGPATPRSGVCGRTEQVRDAIVREIAGVSDCADVTTTHLAQLDGSLYVGGQGIKSVQPGDFSGLTALRVLSLYNNELSSLPDNVFLGLTALRQLNLSSNELGSLPAAIFSGLTALGQLYLHINELTSLPDGVFSGLTALETLHLNNNELSSLPDNVFSGLTALGSLLLRDNNLSSLPDGVFSGLTALWQLWLDGNAEDPVPLTVTLEKNPDAVEIRAVVPAAAPFAVPLRVSVANGGLAGGAATITVPAGARESAWIGVTRTAGTTGAVTADIDLTTQPTMPTDHRGYAFVKSASDLPLTVLGEGEVPPTGFAASNGNEQVTLTWDPPPADADIARHEYRFKTIGDYPSAWTGIDDSAPGGLHEDWVVVAGLTNDVAYTFQLRSVNAGGDGSTAAEAGPATPRSGVCGRTEQVRDTIVAAVSGVSDCADVTRTHLANVTDLYLYSAGIKSLQPDDFSGLTALQVLSLSYNELGSLPDDVFSGLTALTYLWLENNELGSLPAGVFSGLTALGSLYLHDNDLSSLPDNVFSGLANLYELRLDNNAEDPLPLAVTLEKNPGAAEIRAVVPAAAPFAVPLRVSVENGSLAGGAATITVPIGVRESAWVGVTRTDGTTGAVTADIDLTTQPTRLFHRGYAFVKSASDLPLTVLRANAAPSFSSPATFDAAENRTAADTVLATDSDAGDDVTGYAITGGADQSFFSIGATDGALTFKTAPNYEDAKDQGTNNTYVVEVTATSGAGEREKTATQTITVTVTDVDTEAPGKPAAPTVTAASTTSLTVSWTAPSNAGPAITDYDYRHRTTSPEGTWTEVTGTTITTPSATIGSLAENTSYDVQVRATNDEGTGSWSDAGTGATDANAAPSFSSPATFDAAENRTAADTVLATDSDAGDDVTGYAITGGADQSFFSIGATDGALTFKTAPNYEDAKDQGTNNTYVVEVTATSGAGEREKTATQTITVTVTDVDTEAPGKPAAPTVTAASTTSLTVSWTAPSNAGPAITD